MSRAVGSSSRSAPVNMSRARTCTPPELLNAATRRLHRLLWRVDWTCCEFIDSGSFARVYRCMLVPRAQCVFVRGGRRACAVKIFVCTKAASAMRTEAAVYRDVGYHPNVVGMFASGVRTGMPWIALECADGCLFDLVKTAAHRCECEARAGANENTHASLLERFGELATLDVGAALAHMHARRVAHRDIKLDNVLFVRLPGQVLRLKLADMGLATWCTVAGQAAVREHCGTAGYMAPEVVRRAPSCDLFAADAWSLGVLLYAASRGTMPFDAASPLDPWFALHAALVTSTRSLADMALARGTSPRPGPVVRAAIDGLMRVDPTARTTVREMLRVATGSLP